ncbi:MAG: hypothetical protein U0670_19825 [Anaerolineae bacterium]
MPTPFTHLAIARRMLSDEHIPSAIRADLCRVPDAFHLGQIAADGHFLAGRERVETHFYKYNDIPDEAPWRMMMQTYPALWEETSDDARGFLGGYIAHLAVDEYWARHMASPHFGYGDWGTTQSRFVMLNVLLILMDMRDYTVITEPDSVRETLSAQLGAAQPDHWLPFLPDSALCEWRDIIHRQIKPGGHSETFEIIAPRLGSGWTIERLQSVLADEKSLEKDLWAYIPKTLHAQVEAGMYTYAREQLIAYWAAGDKLI